MAAAFGPRATPVARAALVWLVLVVLAAPVVAMTWVRTPVARGERRTVAQPIAFDHRFHTLMHADCRYCHAEAERGHSAGLPSTETCAACHSRLWLSSATFAPVRRSLATGRPIAWRRVTWVPDFVYFDHAMHTRKGVGCESCHGRVDTMSVVRQAPPLTMTWCVDCHRDPRPALRPVEQITAMGWTRGPGDPTADALAARYHVRRLTDCSTCHR